MTFMILKSLKSVVSPLNVVDTLEYQPGIGYEGGAWLGGLTGDQRPFDKDSLVYESDLIVEKIEIVGFIKVSLQVNSKAKNRCGI